MAERDDLAAARVALGEGWLSDGAPLAEGIQRKTRALESMPGGRALALIDAVISAHRDDIPPRIRELAEQARAVVLAVEEHGDGPCGSCKGSGAVLGYPCRPCMGTGRAEFTPADPMKPTVAVPRDLVEAIVEDLREGLAIERETGLVLAALLERDTSGGAS